MYILFPFYFDYISALGDFVHDVFSIRNESSRSVSKEGVLVWDFVAVFVHPFISIAYATVQHAGSFDDSFDSLGYTETLSSGFLDNFADLF